MNRVLSSRWIHLPTDNLTALFIQTHLSLLCPKKFTLNDDLLAKRTSDGVKENNLRAFIVKPSGRNIGEAPLP